MKFSRIVVSTLFVIASGAWSAHAQSLNAAAEAHITAAKNAAMDDHLALFNATCRGLNAALAQPAAQRGPAAAPRATPDRSQWHAEPVKVFDNLYFLGMTEYSAWAVVTSDGIIVLDTIFDYSVEDEIVDGLRKVGLDPKNIKYALVSHGHNDHSGGAKYLQDHFGARIIMSAADWDLLERTPNVPKPKRDMTATDGQQLKLGDTTLTFYLTPGHTPGTVSTLIPVKDGGKSHVVAEWGGTGFNFTITPDKPRLFWFETYTKSAEHFRDAAMKAGADALISNHTNVDGSKSKLPAMAKRKAGDAHPYVIGGDSVQRFLTVAAECAKAGAASLSQNEK